MKTLENKTAFVTGGTRGMGEAIVRRFASEGANVVFTYASSAEKAEKIVAEIEAQGGKALAIHADASEAGRLESALGQANAEFGKIDILVNNAAIAIPGTIDQASLQVEGYNKMIDVNIRAVAEAVRTVVKFMPDGGRIINVGSVGGNRIGGPGMADYVATKAAVSAYTRGLAWDLGPRNITVNAILPGATDTDMMPKDEEIRQAYTNAIPLKRLGKVEEIAALANFLAGPESSYITGSSIVIDGGISA